MKAIPLPELLRRWPTLGVAQGDPEELRLKKEVMTTVSSSIAFLAIFFGGLYAYSGYPLSGAIPLGYSLISFTSTLYFFRTKQFNFFCLSQQLLILLLPFLLMWSLGGFANGSVVMIWAFFAPLAALFFIDLKAAIRWMWAFILLLVLSAVLDHSLAAHARPMPAGLNTLYFLLNTGFGFSLVGIMLYYFVRDRESALRKLRQSEAHIRELMLTDPLTGVANRRHLDMRMSMELERHARYGQPLSVIMADIDWFKHVNDKHGHAMGDAVLEAFANQIRGGLRDSDFVARYGGEEFVLLLPNAGVEAAVALAERMREETKRIRFGSCNLHLTASFGVTLARAGEGMAEVLSRADEAMYLSKEAGRDRVSVLEK
jgi:diguanylate cyclase (GGDEF)-like protein